MRKISLLMALVLLLGAVLASCGGREYKAYPVDPNYGGESGDTDSKVVTISSLDGSRKYKLENEISKIVCFAPEAGIIIRALGSASLITAADNNTSKVISVQNVITEDAIASQNADIVFISDTYDADSLFTEDTVYITVPASMTINDTKALISVIEKALRSDKKLEDEIDNKIELAQQTTKDYVNKYPLFIDLGSFRTSGSGTYINEVIGICGGENVFADQEGFLTVTKDQIIAANPYFIFTTDDVSSYLSDSQFKELDCVKENRVFKLEAFKLNYASNMLADVISDIFEKIESVKNAGKN